MRTTRLLAITLAIVSLCVFGVGGRAVADLSATISSDAGDFVSFGPVPSPPSTGVGGGPFTLTNANVAVLQFSATAVYQSASGQANTSQTSIQNNDTTTHTVTITVTATNYTDPPGPLQANNVLTSTFASAGVTVTGNSQVLAPGVNNVGQLQFGPTLTTFVNGIPTQSTPFVSITRTSTTYEIDQTFLVTLAPGALANLQFTTNVVGGVVPEPSTVFGVLTAVPMFAVYLARRRRSR